MPVDAVSEGIRAAEVAQLPDAVRTPDRGAVRREGVVPYVAGDVAAAPRQGRAVHVARAEIDDAAAVLQVPVEDAVSAGAADVRSADDDTGVVDAAGVSAVRAAQRTHRLPRSGRRHAVAVPC